MALWGDKKMKKPLDLICGKAPLFTLLVAIGMGAGALQGREKKPVVYATGPTAKLFELLDNSYDGKLSDYYLIADTFEDPSNPQQMLTHVIRVDYDKHKAFGKLTIHVRAVNNMDPGQAKIYTPEEIYKFGQYDAEKFLKSTAAAPFGQPGDVYLQSKGDMPLASASITDAVRQEYENLLTNYVIPALEKKDARSEANPRSHGAAVRKS